MTSTIVIAAGIGKIVVQKRDGVKLRHLLVTTVGIPIANRSHFTPAQTADGPLNAP